MVQLCRIELGRSMFDHRHPWNLKPTIMELYGAVVSVLVCALFYTWLQIRQMTAATCRSTRFTSTSKYERNTKHGQLPHHKAKNEYSFGRMSEICKSHARKWIPLRVPNNNWSCPSRTTTSVQVRVQVLHLMHCIVRICNRCNGPCTESQCPTWIRHGSLCEDERLANATAPSCLEWLQRILTFFLFRFDRSTTWT